MARVVQRRTIELSGKRCCEVCGAPPQPVTDLAEAVDKMHKALGEVQDALEAQEQRNEDSRTDPGEAEGNDPAPSPPRPDPTAPEPLSLLTAREREILVLVSQGKSNRRVASSLGISEKTVRNHLSAVFSKVGASDRTQAVVMGIRGGIVSIGE